MRNLKRTLSLVMAMALIVGMMVVSASAVSSDFNDSAEITNTEAVDVMTAIGVFEGTDKGAFNPTGILTREQAAQMAFQTLTADMVYYTNKGTTVNTPDGTQVVVGASAPVKVANSKTDDYRTVSADRDEVQQFCEKYFSDLSVNNNGSDDFGRPSEQWKNLSLIHI